MARLDMHARRQVLVILRDTLNGKTIGGCPVLLTLSVFLAMSSPETALGDFSISDLEGTWHSHGLASGSGPEWTRATVAVDPNGNLTFLSHLNGDGESDPPPDSVMSITPEGVATIAGYGNFRAVMHESKDMLVSTARGCPDNDYELGIIQKAGGTFTTADLQGDWHLHNLIAEPYPGCAHGRFTVDSSGNIIFTSLLACDGDTDLPPDSVMNITSDGVVTNEDDPDFHGVMHPSKDMIVYTSGSTAAGYYELGIVQKAGGPFSTADLQGTWRFEGLASGSDPEWYFGTIDADPNGRLAFLSSLNSNGETDLPPDGVMSITTGGVATIVDDADFHGVMSLSKNMIVFTAGESGEGTYDLGLILRSSFGSAPAICGDVNSDAVVNDVDVCTFRNFLADPNGSFRLPSGQSQCSVVGGPTDCDMADVVVLRRDLAIPPLPPGLSPVCEAVGP
jgi:hypothetical protein